MTASYFKQLAGASSDLMRRMLESGVTVFGINITSPLVLKEHGTSFAKTSCMKNAASMRNSGDSSALSFDFHDIGT
jgi:hypothetical protein